MTKHKGGIQCYIYPSNNEIITYNFMNGDSKIYYVHTTTLNGFGYIGAINRMSLHSTVNSNLKSTTFKYKPVGLIG